MNSDQSEAGVCIVDHVTFRCTTTGPGVLQWAVETLIFLGDVNININVAENESGIVLVSEVINITLISVEQDSTQLDLGNITSDLKILVNSTTLGKHVYCSDGHHGLNKSPSIIINSRSKCYTIHGEQFPMHVYTY